MEHPKHQIKLEDHTVSDPASGFSRSIRLLRGPAGQPHQLCLFLDGELYWDKMNAIPLLNALTESGALPTITFAFISHGSETARGHDYTCNDQFGHFIIEKVIPWLQSEVPSLRPGHHLIGGLSLSGLMSAYLALQYPNHFPYCLSQSGSFWWKDEQFTKVAAQHAPIKNRFWLSVGNEETEVDDPPEVSQIVGVNNAVKTLKAIGGNVHYHEYHGGHSMPCWRDELEQALHWLLASKPTGGLE